MFPALEAQLRLQRYLRARRASGGPGGPPGPGPFEPHDVPEIDTGNAWVPGVNAVIGAGLTDWYDSDPLAPTTFNWQAADETSWAPGTHGAVAIWDAGDTAVAFALQDITQFSWVDAGIFALHFRVTPGSFFPNPSSMTLLDESSGTFRVFADYGNFVTDEFTIHVDLITDGGGIQAAWVLPNDETFYLWHYFEVAWDGAELVDADKLRLYCDGVLLTPDSFSGTGTAIVPITDRSLTPSLASTQWGPVYAMTGLPSAPNRAAIQAYLAPVNAFPETVFHSNLTALAWLPAVNVVVSGFVTWSDWFFNQPTDDTLLAFPDNPPSETTAGNGQPILVFAADGTNGGGLTNTAGGFGPPVLWTAVGMYSFWVQLSDDAGSTALIHEDLGPSITPFNFVCTAGVPSITLEDANGVHVATYLAADVTWTAWNYFEIVYDGAGTGNAGKLKLFCNRLELTAASITGTLDTTKLMPAGQLYFMGQSDDGVQQPSTIERRLGPLYAFNYIPSTGVRDEVRDLNAPADV